MELLEWIEMRVEMEFVIEQRVCLGFRDPNAERLAHPR